MTGAPPGWDVRPGTEAAVDRLLDAAGRCVQRSGLRGATLSAVAMEAGCSRPTVYRYFAGRDELRIAFVRREARRLGARIARELDPGRSPAELLGDAIVAALRGVRSDPVLAAWFRPDDVGETLALALEPEVLVDLGAALSGDADAAGWTVRTIVSLLANPAGDDATERRLIDEFLVPVVLPGASVRGTGARRDGAGRVGGGTRRAGR